MRASSKYEGKTMRYVYFNPKTEQEEEYSQSKCIREVEAEGLIFIGHKLTEGGKFYSVERKHRARLTQTKAFDSMLDNRLWGVDDQGQLSKWGLQ